MKIFLAFVFILCSSLSVFGQSDIQYFISVNGNLYLPFTSGKQIYPILGYAKGEDPEVLLGGFGVGFTAVKGWKDKFLLKAQVNASRHAYWDEPMEMKDANNNPLGIYIGKSVDYVLGTTVTLQYRLGNKVALGTGFGGDFMVLSVYDFSKFASVQDQKIRNDYYKFFTPVIPLELSFYLNKVLVNLRYEQGLVNRYRKPLADYEKDNYGLLVFEFGYRLK